MLCRLCLIDSIEVFNIFEGDGERLKIAEIIGQHFWFVPRKDDNISNICCTCWSKVNSFHQFYCFIRDAQKKFSTISFPEIYLKKENDDNDEWMCDIAVNEYVNEVQNNVVVEDIKIKSENCDNDESSHDKFEDLGDPIDIDCINQNNDTDSKIKATTCTKDNLITSFENQTSPSKTRSKTSVEKKRGHPKKRPRNISDSEEDLPLTHFVENKPKREKNKKSDYLEKSKEKDDVIAKFMTLKCEICCEEFTTFAQIRQHFRTKHNKKGYVVCCNKKLYKKILLFEHINKHLNPEYFKCDECYKIFSDRECLRKHILVHKSNFICDQCHKKFPDENLLIRHKLIHLQPEERQFTCDECGKAFSTQYSLQAHHRYVHEKAYGKMCHICAKVISGRIMFEKHQLEHAGIVEPKIQCEKCGAWLKNKSSLSGHNQRLHAESSTIHKCEICGKISPSKRALKSHLKFVHESKRTYQCGICDKAFKRALTLREHMTTHTGEVLYNCPYCPKTFNSNANMHSHRKKMHKNEWEESRKGRGTLVNEITSDTRSKDDKTNNKNDLLINNIEHYS